MNTNIYRESGLIHGLSSFTSVFSDAIAKSENPCDIETTVNR